MTDHTALIERLESAEAGSRELDALVEVAARAFEAAKTGLDREHWAIWRASRSGIVGDAATQYASNPVTTSLDSALALVERVLPGWWWTVGKCGLTCHASIGPDRAFIPEPDLSKYDDGFHADIANPSTPAITLIVALLRALQSKGEG